MLDRIRKMLLEEEMTVDEIARFCGVSVRTIHNHIPTPRRTVTGRPRMKPKWMPGVEELIRRGDMTVMQIADETDVDPELIWRHYPKQIRKQMREEQ